VRSAPDPHLATAAEILSIPGLRPGVAAHVGCGDGKLAIELARGGVQVVHGLATDATAVEQARRNALAAGVSGQVSIEAQSGTRLPYADNLLNLLVADNAAALRKSGVSFAELWRVVAPFNTLVLGGVDDREELVRELAKAGCAPDALHQKGRWFWVVKPLPAVMDAWPERFHDAGHGRVSHDQQVGPATGLRWMQGRIWASSPTGGLGQEILAENGRAFYVETNSPDKSAADLVARDAFNGQQLWSRKIALDQTWGKGWAAAAGGRVFAHLPSGRSPVAATRPAPLVALVALDAATGQLLWSSKIHGEFFCSDGLLIVRAGPALWIAIDQATGREERRFEVTNSYRDAQALADDGILITLEAGPAESADSKHGDDPDWRTSLFKQSGPARGSLVCFDLKTGAVRWKKPNVGNGWPYWLRKGLLMTRNSDGNMNVFDAKEGSFGWSQAMGTKMFGWTAAFYMGDTIWGYIPKHAWYQAYDPATGKVIKGDSGRFKEFGRCAEDLATDRLILGQELQITDFSTGRTYDQFFTRAACTTGYTPAYGLYYNYAHTCSCTDYIRGIQGISCAPPPNPATVGDPPCEHGQAYGAVEKLSTNQRQGADSVVGSSGSDDWPTFRHDPFRSGCYPAPFTTSATALWRTALGAQLSAPVVANGAVYLACTDQNRVVALDARNGKPLWDYLAGGRIDTPPTFYRGLVLFGCRDGWLYALRATDGLMAWRVRLAPEDRLISVRGRLESAWPLFGAVLVDHDTVWAAAGLHGDADGGVWAAALDPATGRVLWRENLHGYPPYRTDSTTRLIEARGKIPEEPTESAMAAADPKLVAGLGQTFFNDVLISNGKTLFLGGLGIDEVTHKAGPPVGQAIFTHGVGMPVDNLIWGVYFERLSWLFSGKANRPSWMAANSNKVPKGNLIALSASTAFCVKFPDHISAQSLDGGQKWLVGLEGKGMIIKALVVAGDRLVVASRVEGAKKGSSVGDIRFLSAADGHEFSRVMLPAAPRFDGMAVGSGLLVVALEDGSVISFPIQSAAPSDAAAPAPAAVQKQAAPPELRPIAVALPPDDARSQLLKTAKLPVEQTGDILAALADNRFKVVVADADPATLQRLADSPDALKTFTARGGWLVLWGLEPQGLALFNRIVGVEHLLRPVEVEKVTPADASRFLPGIKENDLLIEEPGSDLHYPAPDAWYGALDFDDIAPFCTLPGPEFWGFPDGKPKTDRWPRNMVNGFTDENWRLQFVFNLDKGAHTSIPLRLPRRETVTGFSFFPGPYGRIRRIRLVSDVPGVPAADLTIAVGSGRQDFKIPPMPANILTVELVDWEPSVAAPILGVANLWLRVERSKDFRRRVHPLLNPALLVSYPRGKGGILLSQVKAAASPQPARQEDKKRALMTRLLQTLAAP